VPLADALATLEVSADKLDAFERHGDHAAAVRQAWRRLVLFYHPDKRPADYDAWPEVRRKEWNGKFHAVQRAYEACEAHLAGLDERGDERDEE